MPLLSGSTGRDCGPSGGPARPLRRKRGAEGAGGQCAESEPYTGPPSERYRGKGKPPPPPPPPGLTVKRSRASGRLKSGGDIAAAERRSAARADDAIPRRTALRTSRRRPASSPSPRPPGPQPRSHLPPGAGRMRRGGSPRLGRGVGGGPGRRAVVKEVGGRGRGRGRRRREVAARFGGRVLSKWK